MLTQVRAYRWLPAINQGVADNVERFRDLGATMSDETALAAKTLGDQLTDLDAKWTAIKTSVGGVVIPILLKLIDGFETLWNVMSIGIAGQMKQFANSLDILALIPGPIGDKFVDLGDKARNMAASMDQNARRSLADMAIETDAAKPKIDSVTSGLGELGEGAAGAGAKLDPFEKKILSLKDNLSGTGLQQEALAATMALQQLGGDVTTTGVQSLSGLIDKLRTNSVQLSPELAKVALELDKIALNQGLVKMLADMKPLPFTAAELDEALQNANETFGSIGDTAGQVIPPATAGIGDIETKTRTWGQSMGGVNDILSKSRGAMNLLGVEADTALGKALDGASKVFDSFNAILGIAGRVTSLFGGGGGGGSGLLSSIAGFFRGGGGGAASTSAGATAAGSAAAGGGLSLGSLGAFFTNPLTGIIGGGLAGGILLAKLFGKSGNAETTASAIGVQFDALTSDLKDRIQQMGEEIGDFASSLQLNLGDIIAQGGAGGADSIAQKVADTFSFLERGDFTKGQTLSVLGDSIPQLLEQFDQLGNQGTAQVERLLRAAFTTGVEFEGQTKTIAMLGETLVNEALRGGDAWLQATNSIGTTGRESLEFLRNAFGETLPASILESVNGVLGLGSALGNVKTQAQGAATAVGGIPVPAASGAAPGFNTGTPGLDFMNFGAGSNVTLHGQEAVIPRSGTNQFASDIARALGPRAGTTVNMTLSPVFNLAGDARNEASRIMDMIDRNVDGLCSRMERRLGIVR